MWACRAFGPARPPPPPPPPPPSSPEAPSSSPSPSPSPGARRPWRMARGGRRRRPEVLCGAAAAALAALLGCAFLVALKVTGSRAKDVTMPAKLPVRFFSSKSPVHDFFLGQLDRAENIRQDSEITLFFFYAPWCGQSVSVRDEIEDVASRLADQVLFVAINCWWNHGKCRKQKHFFYFPVIYLYHQSFGPIEYKGPMHALYIEKFVRRVMSPLLYISSRSKLQEFLSGYEPGVLGYFEFNASPQPPGYLTFFTSALHSLNKDYLGTIHFGVITDPRIAEEISLASSGSIYLHRQVNASLLYPHEAANYTAENLWKWAVENSESFLRWLRPHGGKSLLLHNELKKGPALFLFLPFDPLADSHPLVEEISRLALEYNRCNGSRQGEREDERGWEGDPPGPQPPLPLAESLSTPKPPCCNTVVLPPPWPALSRTHNVCELCVNQTAGVQPRRLGRLPCNFFEIEAALDSFYLKEQTFAQVAPRAVSLCRNFFSFYSPFSYYTACCRTVDRGPLRFVSSREASALHPETWLASPGKRWEREPPGSIPHIEGGRGLLPEGLPCSSAITGLSCRTNKTLNLYLLDSNLFWMFAERLGASPSAPVKEFAAIVDLREEMHYVLDQAQAPLLTSSLETFIQNYSVLYSPLKRYLLGDLRPGRSEARHRIREVTTRTFHEIVLRSKKDVLLLYYAPWCGFCTSLNHVFIQLARVLPPESFMVARVDVSQNDLPWEFMTDRLPNVLFFPHGRKAQSVPFPPDFPLTLPNLLKFALRHSRPPPSLASRGTGACCHGFASCFPQGRISHLEREVEKLRRERQAARRAQAQLLGRLSEAREEEQRLQQEARILREQRGVLESQRERLQGLYEQKTRELEGLAEKLQELAEASERLLAENTFLKVLLASVERKLGARSELESNPPSKEAGLAAGTAEGLPEAEKEDGVHMETQIASEPSKDNWTE